MRNLRLLILLECAIFAAIAMVLSFIPLDIGSSFAISLGMIPIYILAMRRGFWAACFAGLLWGLLHFLTGKAYILTLSQAGLEYIVAFVFVAFSGVFAANIRLLISQSKIKQAIGKAWVAMLLGGIARYFWHYVAGVIFWGAYAFKGWSAQLFSLVMNGASCLATIIVCGVVVSIMIKVAPRLFLPK
ncbi:energy-coupled thiamine transporter ThiT [Listeria sp. PSOL-1]|uniref:energy-coupled thiamine transporter ThiT n=1 Tax=Listeria sp. PSOL-1 TaxID=1844999 RepID=UPI0013CFD5AE|nr:energy-coupled thiamine transporter ThiT [Listeria sp. PSOL-1]